MIKLDTEEKSPVASERQAKNKCHNPVESMCRKIKMIQKRDQSSHPIVQMIRFHSRNFDSIYIKTPEIFEETLNKLTIEHSCESEVHFSSLEKVDVSYFQPLSSATQRPSHLSSPEKAIYSFILQSPEEIFKPRITAMNQKYFVFLMGKNELTSSSEFKDFLFGNDIITSTLDFHYVSNQSLDHSLVARRLSLNKKEGKVAISKIMDYLRLITNWESKDNDLEELWTKFDPEKRDFSVDLETYYAITKEWIADHSNRWLSNSLLREHIFLKEELEELKINLNVSEEEKTKIATQYKQSEKENQDLILKIQYLQEENTRNVMDIDRLERKIEELTKSEIEHQMKLYMCENALLNKDASLHKKDLLIENLKPILVEYSTANENLQEEKNQLVHELQKLKEELRYPVVFPLYCPADTVIIQLDTASGSEWLYSSINSSSLDDTMDKEKMLLLREPYQMETEFTATRQKLHEEISKVEMLIAVSLQWVTDPEINVKEILFLRRQNLKHDLETKLNLCILKLSLLGNYKESLNKEFIKVVGNLKRFKHKYHCVKKELHFREKQLEAIKRSQEDALNKGDTLRKQLQEAIKRLENAEQQVKGDLTNLPTGSHWYDEAKMEEEKKKKKPKGELLSSDPSSLALNRGSKKRSCKRGGNSVFPLHVQPKDQGQILHVAKENIESLQCKLEEAVSEKQDFQALNITLSNACHIVGLKRKKLKCIGFQWKSSNPDSSGKASDLDLIQWKSLLDPEIRNCFSENLSHHDSSSTTDLIQEPLKEQTRPSYHKKVSVHEAGIHKIPLNLELVDWYTPLLDVLYLDNLTKTPRLNRTNLSCISNTVPLSCERSDYGEVKDESALDIILKGQKEASLQQPRFKEEIYSFSLLNIQFYLLLIGAQSSQLAFQTTTYLFASATMDDVCGKENLVHQLPPEDLRQASEYPVPPLEHISSVNNTVASSDSSSGFLTITSDHLDSKVQCEIEETAQSASIIIENQDKNLINEDTPLHCSVDEKKITLNLETKEGPETVTDCKEEYTTGGEMAASTIPVTSVKSVNFRQSDHISTNEKEVEAEFLRLSLGFKCDWFTLEKRVKLEERSRDLAEENLKKEITNCLKLLKNLIILCEDDNQAQEIIKKLEKSLKFLNQCTTRVASKAEMLGAINQESRVSKAVEVMIQHVENLKRMYAKEHAELEELKQVLLQNERPFSSLENEDDTQIKKRSASLNSKPSSLRRVSIATLPRNFGNTSLMSGIEKNDRFSRRSSSWRILGSKQSEHRPSLQHFSSTYSWADDEGEKHDSKDKEESEPPAEEVLEETRKLSLSEKKKNQSRWDVSSLYDTGATWVRDLKTSFQKTNITLWMSVVLIVLFAAFMSFLTGRFFQRPVDAAPVENGGSWTSLQQTLWPYSKFQHKRPPPI
ncbi:inositol 1,4,5-triphosphate receptor associated 2 [Antechinus flavipes]|uniref:inositol 1,4,5-triphosphate receptor associated 2 n=1 Tax=Antechinus flavipes TaxID=38775 RepID=UPI0022369634|nr:inositol 1,4,5-triphosphate receptor associated 2 [Antechinus flavipes]